MENKIGPWYKSFFHPSQLLLGSPGNGLTNCDFLHRFLRKQTEQAMGTRVSMHPSVASAAASALSSCSIGVPALTPLHDGL